MHDFGAFCYLDVQKTGSSFVSAMLRKHVTCKVVSYEKHGRPDTTGLIDSSEKLYFISARNPVDQYLSLYNFGCDGKGNARRHALRLGHGDIYDGTQEGFERFIEILSGPEASPIKGAAYGLANPNLIGVMTFRYLRLALPGNLRLLSKVSSKDELIEFYRTNKLPSWVLKTESLASDLERLFTDRLLPYIADLDVAVAEIRRDPKVNKSKRRDRSGAIAVTGAIQQRIQEREWFFYDVLGYVRR